MRFVTLAAGGSSDKKSHSLYVFHHRWTRTNEIAVSVWIIDPTHRGEELVLAQPRSGVRGLLARVSVGPRIARDRGDCVRSAFQHIVSAIGFARFDFRDLFPDVDHGITEAIQLRLWLGFGGLDHQRARDGPAHRGGVEA